MAKALNRDQLKEIINQNDPIGLIALGAPENEYEPEINSIYGRLQIIQSYKKVKKIVFEEFIRWFGEDTIVGKEQSLKNIVEAIITYKK